MLYNRRFVLVDGSVDDDGDEEEDDGDNIVAWSVIKTASRTFGSACRSCCRMGGTDVDEDGVVVVAVAVVSIMVPLGLDTPDDHSTFLEERRFRCLRRLCLPIFFKQKTPPSLNNNNITSSRMLLLTFFLMVVVVRGRCPSSRQYIQSVGCGMTTVLPYFRVGKQCACKRGWSVGSRSVDISSPRPFLHKKLR